MALAAPSPRQSPPPAFERVRPAGPLAPLLRLWQAIGHPLWLGLLLLLFAAAIAGHLLLPQLPTALAADPLARSAWLNETAARWPGGRLLSALGLFDLAHGMLTRVLLPLLAATLIVRLINRLHLAWATRSLSPPQQALPTTRVFEMQQGEAPAGGWQQRLAAMLTRTQGETGAEGQTIQVWGDRNQAYTWAAAALELGLLLMLLAFALNLRLGWQIAGLSLDPGERVTLAPFSAGTIALDPAASTLTLCCQPERMLAVTGGDGPLAATRLRITEVSPALGLTASGEGGPLLLQGLEQGRTPTTELLLRFPQARSERTVALPERNLFLRITGAGPSQFRLQVLDASDAILLAGEVTEDTRVAVEGVALSLHPTRFVTLSVRRQPWLWLMFLGLALFLAGLFVRWRFPYSRVGVRSHEGGLALRWQGQTGARPAPAQIRAQLLGAESQAAEQDL